VRRLFVFAAIASLIGACHFFDNVDPHSVACYAEAQYRCIEYPNATAEQRASIADECANLHGTLQSPGKCPSARFTAKCTLGIPPSLEVRRYYMGADVAQQNDYCRTALHGVWAREF
jgi:hypothetical protein